MEDLLDRMLHAGVGAGIDILMARVTIAVLAIVLFLLSLPLRLFKRTRDPNVAVGLPAVVLFYASCVSGRESAWWLSLLYVVAATIVITVHKAIDAKRATKAPGLRSPPA